MSAYAAVDPFAAASDVQLAPRDIFGRVQVDAWFCVLAKGVGREPYDPTLHRPEERRTAIDMFVIPLAEMNMRTDINRHMVAESKEWASIVLPSLKKIGVQNVRDLNDKWVRVQFAPTGRTYVSQSGETKEATTYKFIAVYETEAACRTAWEASGNGTDAPAPPVAPAPTPTPRMAADVTVTPAPAPDNSPERATAYEFLKVLVKQSNGDQGKLASLIAGVPMVAKYFKETSNEAVALLEEGRRR